MKKMLALIIALVFCLSLVACGGNARANKKAYDDSKLAFDYITKAYLATNEFSSDIYEAWFQGVNNKNNFNDESEMDDFADKMSIDLESIKKGVASLLGKSAYEYGDWSLLPYMYGGSHFSAWIDVISEAYKCSGKAGAISSDLIAAKDLMKTLSNEYSDYEHYPALKEYFTNTLAFFDFCCNPEGTFEQVKDTFNNYRNTAREYFFDLNYVFSDSIGGMEDYNKPEETEAPADTTAPAPF